MPTYENPVVRDAVRDINKWAINPLMRQLAGRRHWYAAAIRHVGRHSGKPYVTPVVAERVPGGVIVPLPYGTGVDWLRNVRTRGRATMTIDGRIYEVSAPRVVGPETAEPQLSAWHRRVFRWAHVDRYVMFSTAE